MTFDRRRALLIGAAVATLMIWAYKLWPAGKPAARPVAPVSQAAAPAAPAPAVQPAPLLSQEELKTWAVLHPGMPRNPFFTTAEIEMRNRPRVEPRADATAPLALPSPLPRYTLTMVMTAGAERLASIGDRVVKVGDTLGTERVAQILPDAVVLDHGGDRRRVELSSGDSSGGSIHIERVR